MPANRPAKDRFASNLHSGTATSASGGGVASTSLANDGNTSTIELVDARGGTPHRAWFARDPKRFFGLRAWSPDSRRRAVCPVGEAAFPLFLFDPFSRSSQKVMDDEGTWASWS